MFPAIPDIDWWRVEKRGLSEMTCCFRGVFKFLGVELLALGDIIGSFDKEYSDGILPDNSMWLSIQSENETSRLSRL